MTRRNPLTRSSIVALIEKVNQIDNAKIILSPTPLDPMDLKNVEWHEQEEAGWRKPKGLWYACGDEWLKFIKDNEFPFSFPDEEQSLTGSFLREYDYAYQLHITSYRKILKINTLDKIRKFTKQYGGGIGSDSTINWQAVAMKYAGIEICPYLEKYRHTTWYYPWDVASGCIWHPYGMHIEEIWRSDDVKRTPTPIPMLGKRKLGVEFAENPTKQNPWEVRSDSGLEGVFAEEWEAESEAADLRKAGASNVTVDRRERATRPRPPRYAVQNPIRNAGGTYQITSWADAGRTVTNMAQNIESIGVDGCNNLLKYVGVEVWGVSYGWLLRCEPNGRDVTVELTDGTVEKFDAQQVWPVAGRVPESPTLLRLRAKWKAEDEEEARGRGNPSSRLFSGVYPTGIVYADRTREIDGDYARVAFLPFSTLRLQWSPGNVPAELREEIERDAATIIARRGQQYEVSSSGQTVTLGGDVQRPRGAPPQYHQPMGRPPGVPNPGQRVLREPWTAAEIASRTVLARAHEVTGLKRNADPHWRVWLAHAPDSYVQVTAGGYMDAMRRAAPQFRGEHHGEVVEMIAKIDGGRAIESLVTIHHGGRLTFHPAPSRGVP